MHKPVVLEKDPNGHSTQPEDTGTVTPVGRTAVPGCSLTSKTHGKCRNEQAVALTQMPEFKPWHETLK